MLDCLEIAPPRGPANASIIWMHGLGADGHDFEPIVPHLHLPRVRFVFPHAPQMPVTLNGGFVMPSWYDIIHLQRGEGRENEAHVRASAEKIRALIAREVERGISPERILLAGFSQGAAMALFVGLRHPQRLAGIVCLSGYLVVPGALEAEASEANAATPIFFGHGTHDEVVPASEGRAAWERLKAGREAEWHTYPMGHQVVPQQIADLRVWLHARLGEASGG